MTATLGTGCGCGCSGSATGTPGQAAAGERTRYYPRQLVSAADLTQDQLYFRERMRRHNRLLHGWGIVCGAEVRSSKESGCVEVNAGFILGPYGDEILIDGIVTVDVNARNADGDNMNGYEQPDPWCAEVKIAPRAEKPVYLAIAYAEHACRPVQAAMSACSCGCDETVCEYSRWRDSYRIRVLDELPDTYSDEMTAPWPDIAISCPKESSDNTHCHCPACSSCPTSPWVILADLSITGDGIGIDCDAHRRYVASFRDFYFMCPNPNTAPKLKDVLVSSAIERLRRYAGDLVREVIRLPARNLAITIPEESPLNPKIEPLTIEDIASSPRDAFVANMTTDVAEDSRDKVAALAGQLWEKAVAAKRLAERQGDI
ncbi:MULTISPECIES: hypothetical protein [unclassified Mycobacterium]|uniref:hypothetical protein n=1 Tax=unclassified Mycobacterium TaxID=2642494 RepID=UPI000689D9A2|nr:MULTISPECIES: hypothetical protein [unclassified Mycobacterium]SEB02637.1 hypothetical protein SAMN04488580_106109 [Mycobacterium sp. 283mftsu]